MRWIPPGAWALLLLTGCASWPATGFLEQGSWTSQRHTLKELRDLYVIKQQEDYSCGAAALATLMIYYFGDHTSEKEILDRLEAHLTTEENSFIPHPAFGQTQKGPGHHEISGVAYSGNGFPAPWWGFVEVWAEAGDEFGVGDRWSCHQPNPPTRADWARVTWARRHRGQVS